jgi:hypothetical protein
MGIMTGAPLNLQIRTVCLVLSHKSVDWDNELLLRHSKQVWYVHPVFPRQIHLLTCTCLDACHSTPKCVESFSFCCRKRRRLFHIPIEMDYGVYKGQGRNQCRTYRLNDSLKNRDRESICFIAN